MFVHRVCGKRLRYGLQLCSHQIHCCSMYYLTVCSGKTLILKVWDKRIRPRPLLFIAAVAGQRSQLSIEKLRGVVQR